MLILEKVSAFDMEDEKNKIKLLIDEGLLYNENKDNYALYPDTHDMKQNKLDVSGLGLQKTIYYY